VLAVVVCGLYLSHNSSHFFSPSTYIREKDFVPKSEREMVEMLAAYETVFKKLLVAQLAAYEHVINQI
jgi:hypothetical protein